MSIRRAERVVDSAAERSPRPSAGERRTATVADAMLLRPKPSDPTSTVADLVRFFSDEHVHAALIIDHGILVTVVERDDLTRRLRPSAPARQLGTLSGRTVMAATPLSEAMNLMTGTGRRRLAVVDQQQRCLGLLCLKRSGAGFCSDQDVAARAASLDEFAGGHRACSP